VNKNELMILVIISIHLNFVFTCNKILNIYLVFQFKNIKNKLFKTNVLKQYTVKPKIIQTADIIFFSSGCRTL